MNKNRSIVWLLMAVVGIVCALWAAMSMGPDSSPASMSHREVRSHGKIADAAEAAAAGVPRPSATPVDEPSMPPGVRAGMARLNSDLQTLRSQIEIYTIQHGDTFPGMDKDGTFNAVVFGRQMCRRTNAQGRTYVGRGNKEDYSYGPYLRRLPVNPFVPGPRAGSVSGGAGPAPRDGGSGWYFDTATQTFAANHQVDEATGWPVVVVTVEQRQIEGSLRSALLTVRSQLDMYRLQHDGRYPGLDEEGDFDEALFVQQLTSPTTATGEITTKGGTSLGPYIHRFPTNPFMNGPKAGKISSGTQPVPRDGSTGWYFNTRTHTFSPNHTGSIEW